MAICRISTNGSIHRLDATTFEEQKVREGELRDFFSRDDNIEAIEEDLMVVGKEVNVWRESQRYIDLLCIDKEANLVVLEFKRTKKEEYMEWQALRYAAMISACSFDRLVDQYAKYLRNCDGEQQGDTVDYRPSARNRIENFLGYTPDDESFGNKARIILVAAGFPSELTATVLWLNENYQLGIRCVEISPSKDGADTVFEVRTIIPLPMPKEYQVGLKEKKEKAQTAQNKRNNLKFNLKVGANDHKNLPCGTFMLHLIRAILKDDSEIRENIEKVESICRNAGRGVPVFWKSPGNLTTAEVVKDLRKGSSDRRGREKRFHKEEDELLRDGERTYAINKGWYCEHAKKAAELLKEKFDFEKLNISYEQVED